MKEREDYKMKEREDYKMKKLGIFAGVLLVCGLLVSSPAMALTIQDLIDLNATGGYVTQDKIFSDFSYSGEDSASLINAALVFTTPGETQDMHGWLFTNTGSSHQWSSLSGATGFTLGYTISVDVVNFPSVTMTFSQDQFIDGQPGPSNLVTIVDTQSVGTLNMNALTSGGESVGLGPYAGVTSITTRSVAVIPEGLGITSYEQDWFQNVSSRVPEPSMLLLLGLGLVGVAGFRKKFKK